MSLFDKNGLASFTASTLGGRSTQEGITLEKLEEVQRHLFSRPRPSGIAMTPEDFLSLCDSGLLLADPNPTLPKYFGLHIELCIGGMLFAATRKNAEELIALKSQGDKKLPET